MNLIQRMAPSRWRLTAMIFTGLILGFALFILYISKAPSYLSDDPATCMNCHIMAPQYATWMHSSHREWTNCNDCHVPHHTVIGKYWFKARDGMRHASIFTMRKEPQVIFIREEGREVVQENCVRCHSDLLTDEKVMNYTTQLHHERTDRHCWECHRETPHGRVNSISSVPWARVPTPEAIVRRSKD